MKRLVIAVVMLIFITGVCFYSLWKVESVDRQLNLHIEAIINAIEQDDSKQVNYHVEKLSSFWKIEENKLVHIVRHAQVDEITRSVSRLSALGSYRSDAQLLAELDTIRWLMSHILDSEPPTWQNIL